MGGNPNLEYCMGDNVAHAQSLPTASVPNHGSTAANIHKVLQARLADLRVQALMA